ncbi:DUF3841 domain-containing protein [Clostridium sp. MCC334]|nr:DUF3841 domain-containing protein [Clostridium sp. MCC334]
MNGNAVRVWTKQHENVLRELETKGRYVARREYIQADLGEHAPLVLEAYDWLVKHTPAAADRPADADYPIWVSLKSEATMLKSPGTVILELTLDPSRIVPVNIMKWGAVLDYSYIPADQEDAARHRKLLEEYRVSDSKAYMSQFYPEIKREIIKSWDRLFDARVDMGNPDCYGNIWEIKKEWITDVLR